MPPKGHSSSSHSSSSRSSFSSSRSRSSSSRSYSSSSSRSYSSGPSSHSSSSHSSYSSSSAFQKPKTVPNRPRTNQPAGFMPGNSLRPAYHYARRHDYIFYPVAWIDRNTGTSYEAGYYDENGTRYDSVAFKNGDSYDNVVCHCPYCEQDTILNLTAEQVASKSLQCPHCGGQMQIQSALDEYTSSSGSSAVSGSTETVKAKKKNRTLTWVVLALAVMLSVNMCNTDRKEPVQQNNGGGTIITQNNPDTSNTALFGSVINLVQREGSAYGILGNDSVAFDKTLIWDADAESYYDASSECWLWYNTDISPSVWQYWYEGISSDYDDSGWMEFDEAEQCWYIEASDGNWIRLPERYDSSGLWHIEN